MAGRTVNNKQSEEEKRAALAAKHVCRDCEHCEPYMRFETLTVKDRKPTMGICPYSTCKVLMSQKACKEHFLLKKLL